MPLRATYHPKDGAFHEQFFPVPHYLKRYDGHMRTNSTIEHQINHCTIRKFDGKPLPPETLEALETVAMRTASSQGLQHSSIIRITDNEIRNRIAKVCTQQYVAEAPELWIFIVDTRRAYRISKELGKTGYAASSYDAFVAAFTDATLMAQNVVNAAESMGLGTTFLGSILNDPHEMCEILGLPELTFPVLGLIMGVPAEHPQTKPRMPKEFRIHTNTYEEPDNWITSLSQYDEEITPWIDLRKGTPFGPFTATIADCMESVVARRAEILPAIASQGFKLETENVQ